MNIFFYIVSGTVEAFLYLISFAVALRLLLPLIGIEEGMLFGFTVALSEPVVAPVRGLLNKSEFFQSFPMDFSGVITILIIMFIFIFMPAANSFL